KAPVAVDHDFFHLLDQARVDQLRELPAFHPGDQARQPRGGGFRAQASGGRAAGATSVGMS
ncbi:MAG: hypothetical protein WB682_10580, partial [Candidatus Dormiibacterota bacterium]